MKATVLRLATAYGPRMRESAVISRFIKRAVEGKALTIFGDGSQFRQFTRATDIGNAFVSTLSGPSVGGVYNIASAERTTMLDLAKSIVKRFPTAIEFSARRPAEPPSAYVSTNKAASELGWRQTVGFSAGLDELLDEAASGGALG